jgi:hypothetical protein
MRTLDRRILRLETVAGRRVYRHLSDEELDAMLVVELRTWLETSPQECPNDLRGELRAFVDARGAEGRPL